MARVRRWIARHVASGAIRPSLASLSEMTTAARGVAVRCRDRMRIVACTAPKSRPASLRACALREALEVIRRAKRRVRALSRHLVAHQPVQAHPGPELVEASPRKVHATGKHMALTAHILAGSREELHRIVEVLLIRGMAALAAQTAVREDRGCVTVRRAMDRLRSAGMAPEASAIDGPAPVRVVVVLIAGRGGPAPMPVPRYRRLEQAVATHVQVTPPMRAAPDPDVQLLRRRCFRRPYAHAALRIDLIGRAGRLMPERTRLDPSNFAGRIRHGCLLETPGDLSMARRAIQRHRQHRQRANHRINLGGIASKALRCRSAFSRSPNIAKPRASRK